MTANNKPIAAERRIRSVLKAMLFDRHRLNRDVIWPDALVRIQNGGTI